MTGNDNERRKGGDSKGPPLSPPGNRQGVYHIDLGDLMALDDLSAQLEGLVGNYGEPPAPAKSAPVPSPRGHQDPFPSREPAVQAESEAVATPDKEREALLASLAASRSAATNEAELTRTKDRLQRLSMDFQNYRRRTEQKADDNVKFANEKLLKDILPILDNLERATTATSASSAPHALSTGVRMVLDAFLRILGSHGLESFQSVGEKFDPNIHEAVQVTEASDQPPGMITDEIVKGYMLHGRLLRPARVVVTG